MLHRCRYVILTTAVYLGFMLLAFHMLHGDDMEHAVQVTARRSPETHIIHYYDKEGNVVNMPGLLPDVHTAEHLRRSLKQNDVTGEEILTKEERLRQSFPDNRPKVLFMVKDLRDNGTVGDDRKTIIAEVLLDMGFIPTTDVDSDWDTVVGWKYFYIPKLPKPLKPHQKVPFILGHEHVTDKRVLYRRRFPFMPPSFQIPAEKHLLQKYAEENPDSLWLHKRMIHRGEGVTSKTSQEIVGVEEFSAAQLLLTNPLLVDGKKIDLAVYVAVLSIDPLRVYVYNNDWYIRFCPEDYHPFDINNRDKYVVQSSNYLTTWDMPSLRGYYDNYTMSHKESLFAYLKSIGHSSEKLEHLEKRMFTMIRSVYLHQEKHIIKAGEHGWRKHGTVRNFFELTRADFFLTDDLDVHLIEIGIGPSMSPLIRPKRTEQFRKVQYSLNELVGFGAYTRNNPWKNSILERGTAVVTRDLGVDGERCVKQRCAEQCHIETCKLCVPCLEEDLAWSLADAYMEHSNKNDWRRIIPQSFNSRKHAREVDFTTSKFFDKISEKSRLMHFWFQGKCIKDETWCT